MTVISPPTVTDITDIFAVGGVTVSSAWWNVVKVAILTKSVVCCYLALDFITRYLGRLIFMLPNKREKDWKLIFHFRTEKEWVVASVPMTVEAKGFQEK